jgi:hypothetical protein
MKAEANEALATAKNTLDTNFFEIIVVEELFGGEYFV